MNAQFTSYLTRIEKEIAIALPSQSSKDWAMISFGKESGCINESHWNALVEPTKNLIDLGGKRWRPLLLVLCAESICPQKMDRAYHLTPLVEFVHTASLIHDDIEDSSDMRRGKPAAYITYGMDTAINAASWLYFEAAACIDTLDADTTTKEKLYASYARELRRLHLGQAMDITWHKNADFCPSVDEYIAMVKNKTGTLASLSAKTGTLIAGADNAVVERAGNIAAEIGAGFQIIDDVINLTSGNPGKKRGDDIVEGKKSLPVLMFMQKYGTDSKEAKILRQCFTDAHNDGIDSPAVERAIGILSESNVIKKSREQGITFIDDGCSLFKELFGNGNNGADKISSLFSSMIPAIL